MVAEILASGTPTSSTGVNSELDPQEESGLKCRVDYLSVTFNVGYLDSVFKIVSSFLGGLSFEERNFGIQYFVESYEHPTGVIIGVGRRRPHLPPDYSLAYLELKGEHLASISASRSRKLLRVLLGKVDANISRIDLTIDDYDKRICIPEVRLAVRADNFTGFRRKTFDYREIGGDPDCTGYRASLGRRGKSGSGKYWVIYDKDVESGGKIKSIRQELSLYGYRAQQAAHNLAFSPLVNWGEIMRSWICSSVDFIQRPETDDHKSLSNCPRLDFWQWFAEGSFKIEPDIPYKISTIEGKIKFIKRIAPTIALVVNAILKRGSYDDLIYELFALCFDGESRFTKYHLHLLELW